MDDAEVMQPALGGHRRCPHTSTSDAHVACSIRVHPVAEHDHVEVLGNGVHPVGERGIRGRGEDVVVAGELQDIRCVPAPAPLDMEGVDRPASSDGDGVGNRQGLVQAVGMQCHLHVEFIGHAQCRIDRAQRGAGVLMHLEPAGMGEERFAN